VREGLEIVIMEDNKYLWDRTGEVDPEIQELEEVLGTLRYQPRPLRIPADIQISRRRTIFPPLAIAAAIALIAVAVGIWFSLSRRQSLQPLRATTGSPVKQTPIAPEVVQPSPRVEEVVAETPKPANNRRSRRESARNPMFARHTTNEIRQPKLTPEQLANKEQVLVALRLVSAKLNIAQRRTQGAPLSNVIRNHRIG
jgi:hypothetical protein